MPRVNIQFKCEAAASSISAFALSSWWKKWAISGFYTPLNVALFFLLSISFSWPFCADKCPLKIKGCTFTRLSEETVIRFIGGKLVTQQKNVPLSIFFLSEAAAGGEKKSIWDMFIKQNSKSIPNNPMVYRETAPIHFAVTCG